MKVKSDKKILLFAVFVFIISGFAYSHLGQLYERLTFILFILTGIASIRLVSIKLRYRPDVMDVSYAVFIVSFFIDAVLYQAVNPFVYGMAMFIMYLLVRSAMLECFTEKYYDINFRFTMLVSAITCLLCMAIGGIYTHSYRGIFGNPNTLGIFAAGVCTVVISRLADHINQGYRKDLYLYMILATGILFIIVSGCRTALLATVLQCGCLVFLNPVRHRFWIIRQRYVLESRPDKCIDTDCIFDRIRSRQWSIMVNTAKRCFGATVLVIVAGIVFLRQGTDSLLYSNIINKFKDLAARGDITNGRLSWWMEVWEKAGPFGDGTMVLDQTVHNVYFGLMNTYGRINGISFFIFIIILLVRSFRFRSAVYEGTWKYLPMMSAILFFMVSLTENYLMTTPMILLFISIPILMQKTDHNRGQ